MVYRKAWEVAYRDRAAGGHRYVEAEPTRRQAGGARGAHVLNWRFTGRWAQRHRVKAILTGPGQGATEHVQPA